MEVGLPSASEGKPDTRLITRLSQIYETMSKNQRKSDQKSVVQHVYDAKTARRKHNIGPVFAFCKKMRIFVSGEFCILHQDYATTTYSANRPATRRAGTLGTNI